MKLPRAYTPLAAFVAPAHERSELWRVAVAIGVIPVLTLLMATAVNALIRVLAPAPVFQAYVEATSQGPGQVLYLLLAFTFFIIAAVVVTDLMHRRPALSLLGRPRLAWWQGRRVLLALVLLNAALWVLPPWDADMLIPGLEFRPWLLLLPISLLAVLIQVSAEELVFRGYLLQQLAARFSHPAVWMVAPSAVFGALHHDPSLGASSVLVMASAMMFGIAASDLTARSGSLGPAIALHFINNVQAILLVSAQEELGALALYRMEIDLTDPAQLRTVMMIDAGVLFCSWLAARVALRR